MFYAKIRKSFGKNLAEAKFCKEKLFVLPFGILNNLFCTRIKP